ncbi:MAG: hypothetical protein N2749_01225 [Clostridia bacterium]|nr:hypothetical protein [Clostridia bacterium]
MKIIRKSTPDEMIAVFLKSEVTSKRFSKSLVSIIESMNIDLNIITNPDITNNSENSVRRSLLNYYRGYENNKYIFKDFPKDIEWYYVELTQFELKKVKYINYNYWVELSSGSRLAIDALEKIQKGIKVFDKDNDDYIKAALEFRKGAIFDPLIIVAPIEEQENMVVLEGHLRLTAYMLEINHINSLEVLIGYSPKCELEKWYLF